MKKLQKGFTLIELLVVIGILAILLAITLVAINPQRQFAQSDNTKRSSDVNAILNAIHQYAADNNGDLPAGITTTAQDISDAGADICADLTPEYLAQVPADPDSGSSQIGTVAAPCPATYDTDYQVVKSATNNRVTVTATETESPATTDISVTR